MQHDDFFTGQKPAVVLKHAVLAAYATPFFSMIGKFHKGPMWLIDGYAGPGKYDADDNGKQVNGSPVVALALARKQAAYKPPRDVRCAFIEADKTLVAALRRNVKPFQDQGLHADVHHGSVADELPKVWTHVADNPVLTFIDPFGVSAVSKDTMTKLLLAPGRKSSSEVLVNINIEAISRHGGYLRWGSDNEPEIRADLHPQGVELSDSFFGGTWWRRSFLEARDQHQNASQAAIAVVETYRQTIQSETGASSIVVPIRRSPGGTMLFYFTLFFRHPAAAYKFADAAALGQEKWRDEFRQRDLEEAQDAEKSEPTLFGFDMIESAITVDAMHREETLFTQAVAHIEANIRSLVAPLPPGGGVKVGDNVVNLFGDYLSLAGEKALRKAWNNLSAAGVIRARQPKTDMWKDLLTRP